MEAARRLAGVRPWKVKGEWIYPHSTDVLAVARLQLIEYYLQKRRHTVYNTIRGCNVLKDCKGAERRHGTPPPPILGGAGHDSARTAGVRGGGRMERPSPGSGARGPTGAAHCRGGGVTA